MITYLETHSTGIMSIAAVGGLILSLLTLTLLGFTVFYTRKAARAAHATERASRAWVMYEDILFDEICPANLSKPHIRMRMKWRNSGRSPALSVFTELQLIRFDDLTEIARDKVTLRDRPARVGKLGPDLFLFSPSLFIPLEVLKQQISPVLYARVIYTTIFGEESEEDVFIHLKLMPTGFDFPVVNGDMPMSEAI